MQGQFYVVRNKDQQRNSINQQLNTEFPYQVQVTAVHTPKSTQQVRYAHSLCGALAAYKQCALDDAKRDAKREFGVIIVCTSVVTGERTARLKSFSDYSKVEMQAFITQMEAYLDQEQIPYTHAA